MTQPALGTDRLMQVGIVVADVEATARAWSQVLGLPMPEIRITDVFDDARTEYEGAPTFAQARMAFLHLGQVDLELLEPIGEPSTWNDQLQRHGPSLHHVAFTIEGMAEKALYLNGQGLTWSSAASSSVGAMRTSTARPASGRSSSSWRWTRPRRRPATPTGSRSPAEDHPDPVRFAIVDERDGGATAPDRPSSSTPRPRG